MHGYLPVVEDGQGEGLALRVRAQVGLEAEGVDGRDEGLDGVERRARDRSILGHVTSAGRQHTGGEINIINRINQMRGITEAAGRDHTTQ